MHLPTVGYAVSIKPNLASFRLRVALPAPHIGLPYVIGDFGDVSFFYKLGNPELARGRPIVFDVVNDHFDKYHSVREMVELADVVTAGSEAMAETIRERTGRDAVVIDDPYENDEAPPQCEGDRVLWFGHSVNLPSLKGVDLTGVHLAVCSNAAGAVQWSPKTEAECLSMCSMVMLTGTNPGASSNRVVKAIRAGRFVIVPEDCAESWRQFSDFIWIGQLREGVEWAKHNREEACKKIQAGQKYVRDKFSPIAIGRLWGSLFASI